MTGYRKTRLFRGKFHLKTNIPDSIVVAGHRDYVLLRALADEVALRAGGSEALAQKFPTLLRVAIDDVIMTPKTGRRSYDELEKTEKTYIGTRVEIELRSMLKLSKGKKLDIDILGNDVDIKNTMGSNWMIPTEAVDHPCLLVAADEVRGICYLGLIVARLDCLSAGENKDAKKSVSASGFQNIFWLLRDHPYPANFWRTISADVVSRIFEGNSGNARVLALFREVQRRPITRDVIEAVAQQRDFMRRIRADQYAGSRKGARDYLAREGIVLLSGNFDAKLIADLGLPFCAGSEFISYKPETVPALNAIANAGIVLGPGG